MTDTSGGSRNPGALFRGPDRTSRDSSAPQEIGQGSRNGFSHYRRQRFLADLSGGRPPSARYGGLAIGDVPDFKLEMEMREGMARYPGFAPIGFER